MGERMDKERMENQEIAEPWRVVLEGGQGELTEKKSRFIATVRPVESEEEATAFIEEMKKTYWDASHNCSAFVIGEKAGLTRCSDDGEPARTAGRPMLEVLLGEKIRNAAVVVTRYFGGTLLGTGGLVRAYTMAVKEGLAACRLGTMRYGVRLQIDADYTDLGKIQYLMGQEGLEPEEISYTDRVRIRLLLVWEKAEGFEKKLVEATNGRAAFDRMERLYFVDKDGRIQ